MKKLLCRLARTAGILVELALAIWLFGLIWICGPLGGIGNLLVGITWFSIGVFVQFWVLQKKWRRGILIILALAVFIPYLFIRPSHNRDWVEPQARTSHGTVTGDRLIIHNFRSFDYDAEGVPVGKWESRSFDLNQLRGMDFFMTHWTTDLAGHPIFSFDFGNQGHLAFTIEARLEKSESYTLLAGFYPRYELSYIPCEESDAVRVRTNFRENEDVYLYRTIATPAQARARLLEFVVTMNEIEQKPRFYNVITSNCTTAVRSQMTGGFPFDWRIILNGHLDEMLYERGLLVKAGLNFPNLKRQAYINPKVREHPEKEDFSKRIRRDIAGF